MSLSVSRFSGDPADLSGSRHSNAAHPHAVSAVLHDCGCNCLSDSYAYDANGNQTTRGGATDGRTISWSSYDLPLTLSTQDGVSSQFAYGPNRSRWKQVAVYSASTTETTLYLGGVMEKVTRGAVTEWKHYIPAGAGTMALQVRKSAGSPASATYYVTGDHLGSATAVMQADGTLLSQLSFAAFGSRRGSAWQDQPLAAEWTTITATTRRGFTGHEHLDNLSLVHMNGRVYDPQLGRFLSADPVYGGDLAQPQTLNPYSYAGNNPLSATDPDGFATVVSMCKNIPSCETFYFGDIGDSDFGVTHEKIWVGDAAWTNLGGSTTETTVRKWQETIDMYWRLPPGGDTRFYWQDIAESAFTPPSIAGLGDLLQEETDKSKNEKGMVERPQSQSCTKGGGGWSVLDYIPSFDLPSLPEGLVNFSAGLGDALLFGLGNPARDLLGINGSVDRSAGAYEGGSWTSFGFGAGRLGYAVAVKGYSVAASSGAAASAFRASMRMPGAPVRDLTKYTTDAALRAAAGRSNPLVNAAGAGVAAAGAHGATVGCP